uniref:PKS_ER domain-containing protein n=1 Tax=Bursaphelenchus xylophilus TaxID=6326 RepID=A0A1I7SHF4_BURXY
MLRSLNLTRSLRLSRHFPSNSSSLSRFVHKMPTTSLEVPEKQIACVFDKHNGPIEVREIPVPEVGNNDVLVKILYSGVCHTDLHAWKGDFPIPAKEPPLVGGHEGAGIVVKIGANVKNFKVGDRAGIKWLNGSCLVCEQCRKGKENTCSVTKLSGLTHDGSFQQFAVVKATEATPIPEDLDLAKAAPILCAGVTVYKALKESNAKPGQFIAIPGAGGGLGSFAIQYANSMGLRVVAIDHPSKKEHCLSLGAEVFLDAFQVIISGFFDKESTSMGCGATGRDIYQKIRKNFLIRNI